MSEAYRIKKFHHVTNAKHRRLREEKLVPLLSDLSAERIMREEVDDLLSKKEVMRLSMDEVDALEGQIYTIQNMISGDWLVDFTNPNLPIYVMKFKRYAYAEHKHLYIKHFAEVSHVFELKPDALPQSVLLSLAGTNHLSTLSLDASHMLDRFEFLIREREQKELEEQENAKNEPQELSAYSPVSLVKKRRTVRNGEVRILRPANQEKLDKYMRHQRHKLVQYNEKRGKTK